MAFGDASKLGLPVAVADHPVDMGLVEAGLPAQSLGCGELDEGGRASGVVGVEDRLDLVFSFEGFRYGRLDPFGSHVGDFRVKDLVHVGSARWRREPIARTHRNKAVVALANKLTRIVWAILTKPGTVYLQSKGAALS